MNLESNMRPRYPEKEDKPPYFHGEAYVLEKDGEFWWHTIAETVSESLDRHYSRFRGAIDPTPLEIRLAEAPEVRKVKLTIEVVE